MVVRQASPPLNLPLSFTEINRRTCILAKSYRDNAGLSVLPIIADGSKKPAWHLLPRRYDEVVKRSKHQWKDFQEQFATDEEIHAWGQNSPLSVFGLGVIGGRVSGNLEIVDIDNADLIESWAAQVYRQDEELMDLLVMVETPRPGLHVYYRCEVIEGSQKLAQENAINPTTGRPSSKTLIETRGEGGYVLAPGSPLCCHSSGLPYSLVSSRGFNEIPIITPDQRAVLLNAARALHTYQAPPPPRPPARPTQSPLRRHDRPGDDFSNRVDWVEILTGEGWTLVGCDHDGVRQWRRPGKSDGTSATTNYYQNDLLHVFSSNAHPFELGKSYSKFAAFALLKCEGNFEVAARQLREEGFGARIAVGRLRSTHRPRRGTR